MNEMVSDVRAPRTHFTVDAGLGTEPVSTEPYRSPAYFELEQERIFKRAWLCIGRVERLPKPGSYIVHPIEVAKASVLITRTKDGRSEEQRSELQSIMRNAYAVFCLKKKKK